MVDMGVPVCALAKAGGEGKMCLGRDVRRRGTVWTLLGGHPVRPLERRIPISVQGEALAEVVSLLLLALAISVHVYQMIRQLIIQGS